MRNCPVCDQSDRTEVFRMGYKIPDGWPLPHEIRWYQCDLCGMTYGDGEFTQAMLNAYYTRFYGYGVNNPMCIERLTADARWIAGTFERDARIVDFGGSGDDGRSIIVDHLTLQGFTDIHCINAGEPVPPDCDLIYASHVIEHVFDMAAVMKSFVMSLKDDGLLILDGPDATGLLRRWRMPILDYNTKHINHFRLIDYLRMADDWGFELVHVRSYEMENAPAYQMQFKRLDVARASRNHIQGNVNERLLALQKIHEPVNVWGLGDITWHLLSQVRLDVLDYVDNDPAYRGQTYQGKPVQERPTNDAPIVIMAQGQRERLIANIRAMGIENRIIEI